MFKGPELYHYRGMEIAQHLWGFTVYVSVNGFPNERVVVTSGAWEGGIRPDLIVDALFDAALDDRPVRFSPAAAVDGVPWEIHMIKDHDARKAAYAAFFAPILNG